MRGFLSGLKNVSLPTMMAASISLTYLSGWPAHAASNQTGSQVAASTTASATITSEQSPLTVEVALRNIKDAAHRLRTSTLDVINDIEQRDMVVTGEPMIIQPIAYKDKKSISWAREMLELGPAMPPRKKWLTMDVGNIGELVELLQADVDAAVIPDNLEAQTKATWNEIKVVMQDVQNHYKTLQVLSQGPKFDNIEIGKAALAIYDDMPKLEKPWKQVVEATRPKK